MGPQSIQPDLMIADVLSRWPATVDVFIRHRMACIGCSMAPFMTLEDAIRIYQLNSETFLAELNEAIRKKEEQDKSSNAGKDKSKLNSSGKESEREK